MTVHNSGHQDGDQAAEPERDMPRTSPVKKPFVEPRISHPVDVLEATTYLQALDSGGTGLRSAD